MFWIKKFKVAAFSPLVLKSNIFEKNKKMHRRKKYLGNFNTRKYMVIRFVDFEISNHKGLYVRISVKETIVPVNERYCTK